MLTDFKHVLHLQKVLSRALIHIHIHSVAFHLFPLHSLLDSARMRIFIQCSQLVLLELSPYTANYLGTYFSHSYGFLMDFVLRQIEKHGIAKDQGTISFQLLWVPQVSGEYLLLDVSETHRVLDHFGVVGNMVFNRLYEEVILILVNESIHQLPDEMCSRLLPAMLTIVLKFGIFKPLPYVLALKHPVAFEMDPHPTMRTVNHLFLQKLTCFLGLFPTFHQMIRPEFLACQTVLLVLALSVAVGTQFEVL